MKKQPKLFVFDFDGTALGGHEPYRQFPPAFVCLLDSLPAKGIHWVTNTTWPVESQWQVIQDSGVQHPPVFLTGNTGEQLATIHDNQVVRDPEHSHCWAQRSESFRDKVWPRVQEIMGTLFQGGLLDRIWIDFVTPESCIDFTCHDGCLEQVWSELQPLIDSGDYYSFTFERLARGILMPWYWNKGGIIKIVQQRLGVSAAETIVAGDGSNDWHMFDPEIAQWMVCPSNADPRIQEQVRSCGGFVSASECSVGVIDGVNQILSQFC